MTDVPFGDKVRSLAFIAGGRPSRPRVTEGRAHPETGVPYKTVATEAGTTTEHATRDDRVDAVVVPQTVRLVRAPKEG